jgi:hypothetical protein
MTLSRRPLSWSAGIRIILWLGCVALLSACAAAVGAALAAGDIRKGVAGVQELVASSRSLGDTAATISKQIESPLSGTYRAFQALDEDTIHYYVRTAERPTTPILHETGNVTGYVLPGLAATSLDTLEVRVRDWTSGQSDQPAGHAMFFVEGTQPPDPNARTLYPAAFLGRVAEGESEAADRQHAELLSLNLEMAAPGVDELEGKGIPHEVFSSVAEGIFTLTPDGEAMYHQEYTTADGRTLILHLERISATTLPAER